MSDMTGTTTSLQDRVVRVFVSSTFRDMQAEREELVKRVFPQLRRLCEERGLAFVDVDLRWGVTDEEAAEGKVLPICLAEIERCPFFIGILGQRYGWLPHQIPDELTQSQPWLDEHRHKSVTELEILHGVLNRQDMADRARFYFRDEGYLDHLPADQREEFVESDPARRAKLEALKERILASNVACRVDYPDPQTLGQWVLEDLTAAINQMYSPGPPPDPLDREAGEHEAFARRRRGVYVSRQEHFDQLDQHAAGEGPPLVVFGESGSGKSALLANWAFRHHREHPDVPVLLHFIGATSASTDWAAMLRRILSELKRQVDVKVEIPPDPEALGVAFANALHMAAARMAEPPEGGPPRRLILILDALNQLEDRQGAPDLVWLPRILPAQVRLILSTIPGRSLNELRRRGWPELEVELLEVGERRQLIDAYLAQYGKHLSDEQTIHIAMSPRCANPVYLRAVLQELRVFGEHENLRRSIDHYLAAATVPQLFDRILARWERDYERERANLVRDTMTCLWASRRGLAEQELLELLGERGQPLPRAHWSPLHLAAEEVLVFRSGMLGFGHDYFRAAVLVRYVAREDDQRAAHARLVTYLEQQCSLARAAEELPWQIVQAGDWPKLRQL
ncbi:MAG TPA: DUF4062 domain-containing protein, partial [Phycisphaerae bacterium]|nr:DUF4062 domain-containing protein [Phycisphaerae bacterium]